MSCLILQILFCLYGQIIQKLSVVFDKIFCFEDSPNKYLLVENIKTIVEKKENLLYHYKNIPINLKNITTK